MEDTPRLEAIVIINCALNVLLIFTSIPGNTFVLFIILRTSSHRLEPSFIFLCSLAFSDLFVGFIAQPFYIASEATRQETTLYHLSHVAAFFACGVSLCTTAAVSMDRLAALHFHMRYCSLVTVPRVLCTLVMLWVINVLFSSIYFAIWKVTYIIMAVGIGTCVFISTFSYVKFIKLFVDISLRFNIFNQRNSLRFRITKQHYKLIHDFSLVTNLYRISNICKH